MAQATPAVTPPAAAVTATAQPIAVQRPVPVPNRANQYMPSWLRVRGEFRERFEGFEGSGFVPERDDDYFLSRFRFNATVTPSKTLSFQVQAQDARVGDKSVGPTAAPFQGTFDLRLGFGDVGTSTSRFFVRGGRQELVYGDQRLIGHGNWLNTARSFDGGRVTIRGKKASVDVFAASLVRILADEFDKSGNGNGFFGAYGSTAAVVPQATLEPYVLVRTDRNIVAESGGTGRLTSTTMGARLNGKLPARLDYTVEMAAQAGGLANDSIGAWAGHWRIRESTAGTRPMRFFGEVNMASGDSSPTDGKRATFDQLYPTAHDKYGLADQIGWRNIRHLRGGVELPIPWNVQLSSSYHTWWLMDRHDALYAASGAVLVPRLAAGVASTHVGQELDVQASRAITPYLQVSGGYAHIFPGAFLDARTPGASYSTPYIMATYIFLADK